jgi:hypothetical protein
LDESDDAIALTCLKKQKRLPGYLSNMFSKKNRSLNMNVWILKTSKDYGGCGSPGDDREPGLKHKEVRTTVDTLQDGAPQL